MAAQGVDRINALYRGDCLVTNSIYYVSERPHACGHPPQTVGGHVSRLGLGRAGKAGSEQHDRLVDARPGVQLQIDQFLQP